MDQQHDRSTGGVDDEQLQPQQQQQQRGQQIEQHADPSPGLFGNGQPDDSSATYIDPTAGQPEPPANDPAAPPPLDGE